MSLHTVLRNPNFPLLLVAIVAVLVHSPNILNYPAWFFDEGAYLYFSLQWQQTGTLSYYGHPFGALAVLSLLFAVVNPTSYLLPRILMVVLSAIDGMLLYKLAKAAYSRNASFPLVASLIYVATPLSARYLRLVVVDNFMALFLLLSLLLILTRPKGNVLSALSFGCALVSKQTGLFFIPALIIYFWKQRRPVSRIVLWMVIASIIPIVWILFGVFQVGFSGLISSQFALTALGGERAVNAGSLIVQRIISRDPFIFLGLAGVLWAIVRRDMIVAFPVAYLAAFVLLFLKISTVYLIPALPFFSLLGAALLFDLVNRVPRLTSLSKIRHTLFTVIILALAVSSVYLVVSQNPAVPQQDAVSYIAGLGSPKVIASYTYLWVFSQNYPKVTIYDRYFVPWEQLRNQPVYMIVDYPGDLVTIDSIPQYHQLYTSASNNPYQSFSDPTSGYVVEVLRGTVT